MPSEMQESLLSNDFADQKLPHTSKEPSQPFEPVKLSQNQQYESDLELAKALQHRLNSSNLSSSQPQFPDQLIGTQDSTNTNSNNAPLKQSQEEQVDMVRSADSATYDRLIGGQDNSQEGFNICRYLCGRPQENEPRVNLICCQPSRRILKNSAMLVSVILIYILFLSLMMGSKK